MLKTLPACIPLFVLLLSACAPAWADGTNEPLAELDEALAALGDAPSDALRDKALTLAQGVLEKPAGLEALYQRVATLHTAGVFANSPWADPSRLQPRFVRGTLTGEGPNATREALSCLRVAAIAVGDFDDPRFGAQRAKAFLSQTFALNLDLLFEVATEETRRDSARQQGAKSLFEFLSRKVGLEGLGEILGGEIAATCAQRPIVTTRTRQILARFAGASLAEHETLGPYLKALNGPTPLSARHGELGAYREALSQASPEVLLDEARLFGVSMQATGLVADHHVALVQHATKTPALLKAALALSEPSAAAFDEHRELIEVLAERAVHPARPQAVYGLHSVLERGLLNQPEVRAGLLRLSTLEPCQATRDQLQAWWQAKAVDAPDMDATALLVSGAVSVLGQPLGVSQGQNQTCQSARGISLWSQRDPAYLLACLESVARDNVLTLSFEEGELRSDARTTHRVGVIGGLDPVSALLTPHVDRLYAQIMRRVSGRSSDAHRWANPGLYGGWIPDGFTSCFTGRGRTVRDHGDFVRAFYRTFHPEFNGGHPPVSPNPVGITVTDSRGRYLGLHAVSLLRVATDPQGTVRVYFFNPNGEDRQNWGQGIRTQVVGFGERAGESSLPFADFATRIYAYHHDPSHVSDAEVPDERVQAITRRAQESWGRGYRWESSSD